MTCNELTKATKPNEKHLDRAKGCFLGLIAGDNLGSLVEFEYKSGIRRRYPNGIKTMQNGGTFNTIKGQPTDDGEMALALARAIIKKGCYNQDTVKEAYIAWLNSRPFDVGNTIRQGLNGIPNSHSEANGALMRIAPLGIFCADMDTDLPNTRLNAAIEDAVITHPNPICLEINKLFTLLLKQIIERNPNRAEVIGLVNNLANISESGPIRDLVKSSRTQKPADFETNMGHVIIAFQNALYHVQNTDKIVDAISETIMEGGDTDTNAAIVGALMGAMYGAESIPTDWINCIRNCRPDQHTPEPRPSEYWPCDVEELAVGLLNLQK